MAPHIRVLVRVAFCFVDFTAGVLKPTLVYILQLVALCTAFFSCRLLDKSHELDVCAVRQAVLERATHDCICFARGV